MKPRELLIGAAIAVASVPSTAWDSIIGSAGVPDESCAGVYATSGATAKLLGTRDARCTLRYPISVVPQWRRDGWQWGEVGLQLIDNGEGARVVARLMQREWDSGKTSTLATVDSDTRRPSNSWQSRRLVCGSLDFAKAVYWVEIDLIRTDRGGRPAIGPMRLAASNCDGEGPPDVE